MSREKIEEMARTLCGEKKTSCHECDPYHDTCEFWIEASILFNAGYRKIPDNIGDFSDGYHTFNELYHHRAVLFSVICNMFPDKAWKSKLHDTGDMYDGMFIVGIETEQGQATYHYDIEPYWDMFKVKELAKAPKWDGHTPSDAIERIGNMSVKQSEGEWIIKSEIYKLLDDVDEELFVECSICQRRFNVPYELDDEKIFKYAREHYPYCNCGAKMKGGAEE